LIDVHPIWKTTQELMTWSRISSRNCPAGLSRSM
jgi:hypothetical protein